MTVQWDSRLPFVVAKGAKPLETHLGLRTVGDLLSHYPRRYVDRSRAGTYADLREGELTTLVGTPRGAETRPYQDRRTGRTAYRVTGRVALEGGEVDVTFFARQKRVADYYQGKLAAGRLLLLSGRVSRSRRGGLELTHPELEDEDVDRQVGLKPVYPLAGKLTSLQVERAARAVLAVRPQVPETLPPGVLAQAGLVSGEQALRWIHEPADWPQVGAARRRLAFEEAFVAQVVLAQRRRQQREVSTRPRSGRSGGIADAFDARMPFRLTTGQQAVEEEIVADLGRRWPMHRLLQGEVGSGKTVVALRAMLRVLDSGGQAALLAPTEVLAQQHHRTLSALLGDLARGGELGAPEQATRLVLLTGSLSAAAKRAARDLVAQGEAGIVVGTHALLQESVTFHDLALVVVDEQHRFGVEQRAALLDKAPGAPPHELVMTATPIPRTVAMTVFGDLDVSALTEVPSGRRPVQTTVVPVLEQPAWLDRAWHRVREEVAAGRQVYVVCPRIAAADGGATEGDVLDPDEWRSEPPGGEADDLAGLDSGLDSGLEGLEAAAGSGTERRAAPVMAAVEEVAASLADGALRGLRLRTLHGRMSPEDKEQVMTAFAAAEVDVLVSTTVVEVGVDVPNATTMVVLDADRFGLSQLHQLRGRVGRGEHGGLCLLVTGAPPGSPARVRLDAVAGTSDGFELAELDLSLRREGDVLGASQSGSRRSWRLLSVTRHGRLIEEARAAAHQWIEQDPEVTAHPDLAAAVAALHASQQAEFVART